MGRKKNKPQRSVGIQENSSTSNYGENKATPEANFKVKDDGHHQDDPFYFVDVDCTSWGSIEHRDISEIVLTNLILTQDFIGFDLTGEVNLRFRLCNVNEHVVRIKLGHWPVLASENVYLEVIQKRVVDKIEAFDVIACGKFDGSDEGVTGLVHLTSLKLLSLRLVPGVKLYEDVSSLRLRVEILGSAFEACEGLIENSRQLWKKSMLSVMAWLRPEVTSSEARYGVHVLSGMEVGSNVGVDNAGSREKSFDVQCFYEAIKRSKDCPMLDAELPDLLPELRPYQRRAAYWMVQREKGALQNLSAEEQSIFFAPLCVSVNFLDSCLSMFYNPFSGTVSLCPEIPSSYVFGGILADEMGLGKTVELLACVFTHRKSSESGSCSGNMSDDTLMEKIHLKRVKKERIECICGALSESHKYKGLWVQCDVCDAWQHADCVGYSSSRARKRSKGASKGQDGNNMTKKKNVDIVVMDDQFICQLCLELMQVIGFPVDSGATLIVCPAPILPQWHAEILRHTTPGSLRTCIYEGVKDISLSNSSAIDVSELASADIVLTTYDVLREDLSHDSERHEGDRRLMRYEKRYPVIPTLLTRVFWWRVCLDEAQMVESNVAAATEMALRLHARHRWCITGTPIQRKLDDLYGLLRFLKASPFDVSRWWVEVIRDPYECRDAAAMDFTHHLFRQLMWRSSKSHVADELQLPPQEERVSWLSFSPVEEHFYQRQHETCVDFAHEVLERFKSDMSQRESSGSLSSDSLSDPFITDLEAAKLLNSLLKLRQACCHPQVGGSGLRSLQRSPMTMDEILTVLISKTKIEGEDALRKAVSSLNGLAGIAMIRSDLSQAASLYKEALALAEEHSKDFRLDPLLNLHVHHNLAEVLKSALSISLQKPFCGGQLSDIFEEKPYQNSSIIEFGSPIMKKRKMAGEKSMEMIDNINKCAKLNCEHAVDGLKGGEECDTKPHAPDVTSAESLINVSESIKQKYLSVFYSRLSQSQQEFQKSYMQVCDGLSGRKDKNAVWWLEALQKIEQNKEAAKELSQKIENAVLGNRNSATMASWFRNMNSLKYYIQTGLDSLEASRKHLFDELLEVDRTMEKPREEDIERVRYCPNCYPNADARLCVHCELDELFQAYEARLFCKKRNNGAVISSAEEAVDLQKKKLELNHFYWNLAQKSKSSASSIDVQDAKGKRDVAKVLMDIRTPSELEIILGILRSYFKAQLGREGVSAARRHILLLESMRKEYAQARSLAIAQAQVLRAHDEIKMATSRLRLQENNDDNAIDAVSLEELDIASVENSSEKFLSLATLSRIRGKLRYLQGLVSSKQKTGSDSKVAAPLGSSPAETKVAEDLCPICQESLEYQRMVFQCGHVTCCKCLLAITERKAVPNGKSQDKWVICPTCRQHSDFESIAFADDRQNKSSDRCENIEASVSVQGSYGTKIEAITRRILQIKSTDPNAKILVFSSWNDVLDVLEHAFDANEISYVRMKGGRKRSQVAISIFKGEKTTNKACGKTNDQQKSEGKFVQVLLLLIQHGANGLNLLEAQHVILVEPLLNPAAEAQAISRVHRIGQTNKTLIHRFIVKNTVEESIYKLNKSRNSSSFISGNKKNQDQPILTLKDVESLFAVVPSETTNNNEEQTESLTHLPPSVAAAIAAERRLNQCKTTSS